MIKRLHLIMYKTSNDFLLTIGKHFFSSNGYFAVMHNIYISFKLLTVKHIYVQFNEFYKSLYILYLGNTIRGHR